MLHETKGWAYSVEYKDNDTAKDEVYTNDKNCTDKSSLAREQREGIWWIDCYTNARGVLIPGISLRGASATVAPYHLLLAIVRKVTALRDQWLAAILASEKQKGREISDLFHRKAYSNCYYLYGVPDT